MTCSAYLCQWLKFIYFLYRQCAIHIDGCASQTGLAVCHWQNFGKSHSSRRGAAEFPRSSRSSHIREDPTGSAQLQMPGQYAGHLTRVLLEGAQLMLLDNNFTSCHNCSNSVVAAVLGSRRLLTNLAEHVSAAEGPHTPRCDDH